MSPEDASLLEPVSEAAGPDLAAPFVSVDRAPVSPPRAMADLVRRWRVGLLALAALLALAGVAHVVLGGGSGSEAAIAKAVNLQPSDLPGWVATPRSHDPTRAALEARMKRCVGPRPAALATSSDRGSVKADSPSFQTGSGLQALQVQSQVASASSQAQVASYLALIRDGRVLSCLASALSGFTATSDGVPAAIGGVRVVPLAVSAQGVDGSFGVRMAMTISARGLSIPVFVDLLGYGVGRDVLSLTAFTIGHVFPASLEQQLSADLIGRALARPH